MDSKPPTCDLCYSRKVRCDKDDPCGNCVDSNTTCTRLRRKKIRVSSKKQQPRDRNVSEIQERDSLSTLLPANNSSFQQPARPNSSLEAGSSLAAADVSPMPEESGPTRGYYSRLKRSHSVADGSKDEQSNSRAAQIRVSSRATAEPQSPREIEGRTIIEREIQVRQNLSENRRQVLNSAVSFLNQLAQHPGIPKTIPEKHTFSDETANGLTIPSTEFFYWMLRDIESGRMGFYVSDFFKHISSKSLRQMGLALLRKEATGDELLLYLICVNSTAFKFIKTILSNSQSGKMEDEMCERAERYRSSVLVASERIQLLTQPSLLFLQALISSAFINQGCGNISNCWVLTATACRVCTDIGMSKDTAQLPNSPSDEEIEAYYCFMWCYMLDKNFAMNLGRSSCLINLDMTVNVSSREGGHMSLLLSTYVELAKVQAIMISDLSQNLQNPSQIYLPQESVIHDLSERMKIIKCSIDQLRQPSTYWEGLHPESEIHALEFAYHSIMTGMLRTIDLCSPLSTDTKHIRENCLQSARQSLLSLQRMQQSSFSPNTKQTSTAYVNWTFLYYPLTAFFMLFCNVVTTSHISDFKLMKLITDTLSESNDLSPSVAKLQHLFATFVSLSEHLFYGLDMNMSTIDPVSTSPTIDTVEALALVNSNNTFDHFTLPQPLDGNAQLTAVTGFPEGYGNTNDAAAVENAFVNNTAVPQMDGNDYRDPSWDIFGFQLSLDWLEADVLDAGGNIYPENQQ